MQLRLSEQGHDFALAQKHPARSIAPEPIARRRLKRQLASRHVEGYRDTPPGYEAPSDARCEHKPNVPKPLVRNFADRAGLIHRSDADQLTSDGIPEKRDSGHGVAERRPRYCKGFVQRHVAGQRLRVALCGVCAFRACVRRPTGNHARGQQGIDTLSRTTHPSMQRYMRSTSVSTAVT
jgi:hypothetical protein